MQEKIRSLARGEFQYEPTKLQLSKDELRLVVVSGEEITDSFDIENVRDTKVRGFITSDDFVVPAEFVFDGVKNTIEYTISAAEHVPGEKIQGELFLVTDCGTATLPYYVEVVAPVLEDDKGIVNDYDMLCKRMQTDSEQASALFHSKEFKEVFLFRDVAGNLLYDHLEEKNTRLSSMEDFLSRKGKKKQVRICVNNHQVEYHQGQEDIREKFVIDLEQWGYAKIYIQAEDDYISVDKSILSTDEFIGNRYEVSFSILARNLKPGKYTTYINVSTPYQYERIQYIIYVDTQEVLHKERIHEKKYRWAFVRNFVNFKSGKTGEGEFRRNLELIMNELSQCKDPVMNLIRGYVYVKCADKYPEEVKAYLEWFDTLKQPDYLQPNEKVVYYIVALYIKALSGQLEGRDDFPNFLEVVRGYYENGYKIWELYYFFLQHDERMLRLTPKMKLEEISYFLENGCISPLMYLEAVKTYRADITLVHRLNTASIQALYWGLKEEFFNEEFAVTLSVLTQHVREYSPIIKRCLELQYQQYHLEDTLNSLCSLLIRCDVRNEEDHQWFKLGVEHHLRITELYEYYMYTCNTTKNLEINQEVITYFQYENHLNDKLKAYLFANIIESRKYGGHHIENFNNYLENIRKFAWTQLKAHRISEELEKIYQCMITKEMFQPWMAEDLPQIMFKRRLSNCGRFKGVWVTHQETTRETYYDGDNESFYVDIYTSNYEIYGVDQYNHWHPYVENDHAETVTLDKGNGLDELAIKCYEYGSKDERVLMYLYSKIQHGYRMSTQESVICHMAMYSGGLRDYYKGRTLASLFDYYKKAKDEAMLAGLLEQIDISLIKKDKREDILNEMIRHKQFDRAYTAVEMYGFEQGGLEELLQLATYECEKKDVYVPLLSQLCYYLYKRNQVNGRTIAYLLAYYMGDTKTIVGLFDDAADLGVTVEAGVYERLLAQVIYVGENPESYYKLFEYYSIKGDNRLLIRAFINYSAYGYVVGKWNLSGALIQLILKEGAAAKADVMILAVLRYYSTRKELGDKEREYIDFHVAALAKKGLVMKFMQGFVGRVPMPYNVENAVIIEHYADTKFPVNILVKEDGKQKILTMSQVFPGVFVKEFLLFEGEELNYEILEEETEKRSGWLTYRKENKEIHGRSFYSMVNEMMECEAHHDEEGLRYACGEYMKHQKAAQQLFKLK